MIIAGGGTGGHVFPGIALAEAFLALCPDGVVSFVGTTGGLEARVIPARWYPIDFVPSGQVRGKGIGAFAGAFRMAMGFPAAVAVVRRRRPDLVFGVGGYASVPVAFSAALLRIPLFLQEQNSVPGRSNRLLAHGAIRVFAGFSGAVPFFPRGRVAVTGNPVRSELVSAARERAGDWPVDAPLSVLALGGVSGGAGDQPAGSRDGPEGEAGRGRDPFPAADGAREHEEVAQAVRNEQLPVETFPFSDRMGSCSPVATSC